MTENKLKIIFENVIQWLLLVAIFLVPIYFAWWQENYSVFDLNKSIVLRFFIYLALIVILVFFALSGQWLRLKIKKLFWLWFSLLISFTLSTIFSLFPSISFWGTYERQQGWYNLAAYLLFFILIVLFFNIKRKLNKIIIALNLSSVIICLYGLIQFLGLDFLYWAEGSNIRIFSTFGQPNFLGHWLVVILPLTIYLFFQLTSKFIWRVAVLFLLLIELICLVATYSRGAFIAFIFSLLVFLILISWRSKNRMRYLSILAVGIVIILFFIFSPWREKIVVKFISSDLSIKNRIVSILDFKSGSNAIRFRYWQASLKAFQDASLTKYLFGFGSDVQADVFVHQYEKDWGYYEKLNSFPDRAHNSFFDLLLQFGLVGFIAFWGFVLFILKKVFAGLKSNEGDNYWFNLVIFIALIAYMVDGWFSFPLTTMSLTLFTLLAVAWRFNHQTDLDYQAFKFFQPLSRWLIAIFSVILLGVIFYGYDISYFIADHYYMAVKKAEARGNCRDVLSNLETVLEWHPNYYFSRIYLRHNIDCFAAATTDQAKKIILNNMIDQAAILDNKTKPFSTLVDLSHVYSILGYYYNPKYYNLAEKYYQEAIKINPNITISYQDYGRIKLWQAQYQAARDIFKQGIEATPSLDLAIPGSEHTITIAKQLSYFHQLIGLTYKYENNFVKAIPEYTEAIRLYPQFTTAYKELSDIYYQQKNIDQAISYLVKALGQDNNNAFWNFSLATLYQEKGDLVKALFYAEQAKKLDPNDEKIIKLINELKAKK